jgi:phosphoenolpyruvate synthase/pyruvate phosphate dikinase
MPNSGSGFSNRSETGVEAERAFGSPQDIEGAFAKGQISVVQSRPQVQVEHV